MKVCCFSPVIDENCTVLILGSIPSVKSRENNFYYSNPQNRFWKILSAITGTDLKAISNEEKRKELLRLNIALYDVFSSCEIDGSLDGNIKKAEYNDIPSLIKNTRIKTIYITSKKAYLCFLRRFGEYFESVGIKIVSLPSTSGANRREYKTDAELLSEWKKIFSV